MEFRRVLFRSDRRSGRDDTRFPLRRRDGGSRMRRRTGRSLDLVSLCWKRRDRAWKPAFLKSASLQPSNFDGTLSHQWVVRPGPPAMSPMSLSLQESSTAFLSHWLTVHPPAPFSAPRKLPLSRPDSAASPASPPSPTVAAPPCTPPCTGSALVR